MCNHSHRNREQTIDSVRNNLISVSNVFRCTMLHHVTITSTDSCTKSLLSTVANSKPLGMLACLLLYLEYLRTYTISTNRALCNLSQSNKLDFQYSIRRATESLSLLTAGCQQRDWWYWFPLQCLEPYRHAFFNSLATVGKVPRIRFWSMRQSRKYSRVQ